MIKASIASKDGHPLDYCKNWDGHDTLMVLDHPSRHGIFNAESRAGAGTSIIAQPEAGGSLLLTDLIVTSDKVALASFSVQFTDDTETIVVMSANVNDAPCNVTIPLRGCWRAWEDARLELISVGNVAVTVAVGYMKIVKEMTSTFTEWDTLR